MIFDVHTHVSGKGSTKILNLTNEDQTDDWFSVGIHPWDSDCNDSKSVWTREKAQHVKCLAIGEVGLDKIKGPDLVQQEKIFTEQVALSEQLQLPVILHCVKAWNELKVLKRNLHPTQPWIYHGFTKTALLEEVIHEGLMISFGSSLLNNEKLQKAFIATPSKLIFLETDDSNEEIDTIYRKAASLKNIPLPEFEKMIEENFKRVFKKWTTGSKELNY